VLGKLRVLGVVAFAPLPDHPPGVEAFNDAAGRAHRAAEQRRRS
jgi:hypothetical protein